VRFLALRLPNGLILRRVTKNWETGSPKTFHAKALRVLRREPNGEWKFSRAMWNFAL